MNKKMLIPNSNQREKTPTFRISRFRRMSTPCVVVVAVAVAGVVVVAAARVVAAVRRRGEWLSRRV